MLSFCSLRYLLRTFHYTNICRFYKTVQKYLYKLYFNFRSIITLYLNLSVLMLMHLFISSINCLRVLSTCGIGATSRATFKILNKHYNTSHSITQMFFRIVTGVTILKTTWTETIVKSSASQNVIYCDI